MHLGAGRVALATAVWFVALAGVFMLFVGEWTAIDWLGAAACAVVAAGLTVPLTRQGLFQLRGRLGWMTTLFDVAKQVFVDFGIVTARLASDVAHGRRQRGVFVARADFPAGAEDAQGTAWRAFVTVASTFSPNSYVVDLDTDGTRLSHDLVPNRSSERPA